MIEANIKPLFKNQIQSMLLRDDRVYDENLYQISLLITWALVR